MCAYVEVATHRYSCIQLYRGTSSLYHTAACTILYSLQLRAQRAENLRAADTFGRSGHHCSRARTGWDWGPSTRTDGKLLVCSLVHVEVSDPTVFIPTVPTHSPPPVSQCRRSMRRMKSSRKAQEISWCAETPPTRVQARAPIFLWGSPLP